jgi:hypothetical protein
MPLRSRKNKEKRVSRGIIQKAIDNKRLIMGVELRDFAEGEMTFASELPTIADLIVPGTGRSISARLDCSLPVTASGERS